MIKHGKITALAELVGISRPYMSQILSGRRANPSKKILKRLAALTRTDIALWVAGTPAAMKAAVEAMGKEDHHA